MKRKYGLTYGENKDNVKTERLKGRPKTRQEIYLAVQAAKKSAKDWTTFSARTRPERHYRKEKIPTWFYRSRWSFLLQGRAKVQGIAG